MKKLLLILCISLTMTGTVRAGGMNDDPWLAMLVVDQFEMRTGSGDDPLAWEAEGWLGKDLHKLWLKTDGEYINGSVEEMDLQALYSRAISPFWDLQLGWRRDIRPSPDRDWLAFGFKGLAPYYFDVDAAVFLGDEGRTAARLQLEYEFMFTQRLILVPELELNFYGKDDPAVGIGSGLSDIEAGLRLRYEIRREFAPYIGVSWTNLYGRTADYAREEGEDAEDFRFVAGIRFWF